MSWSLDHNLDVFFPCTFGQLPKAYQLLDLTYICCISQASRTACISKGDGYIILTADVKNLIIIFIERVLLARHAHPCKNKGSSSGNDVHFSLMVADLVDSFSGDSAVKRYEIYAILCVKSYYIDEILGCQCVKVSLIVDNGVINRNRSDHCRTLACQFAAEWNGVSVGGQIHNGMCAHVYSFHNFLHFHIVILAVSGYTEIYIDLGAEHGTYTFRINTFMIFICTDNDFTGCYQWKKFLCCHSLFFGYNFKFRCDDAFTGSFHLCTIISHVKKSPFVSTSNV